MKITKWVDMGAEVEVEIGADDIRSALAEAFETITQPRFEEKPTAATVARTLNDIGTFLNGITDAQIGMLKIGQLLVIEKYLRTAADRFKVPEEVAQ